MHVAKRVRVIPADHRRPPPPLPPPLTAAAAARLPLPLPLLSIPRLLIVSAAGKRCAGSVQRRRLAPLAALEDPLAAVPAARPEGVAWDPDGLLPPPTSESHFERRARLKAEAAAAAGGAAAPQAPSNSLRPIPAEQLAAGGLPAADGSLYDRPAFEVSTCFGV